MCEFGVCGSYTGDLKLIFTLQIKILLRYLSICGIVTASFILNPHIEFYVTTFQRNL